MSKIAVNQSRSNTRQGRSDALLHSGYSSQLTKNGGIKKHYQTQQDPFYKTEFSRPHLVRRRDERLIDDSQL